MKLINPTILGGLALTHLTPSSAELSYEKTGSQLTDYLSQIAELKQTMHETIGQVGYFIEDIRKQKVDKSENQVGNASDRTDKDKNLAKSLKMAKDLLAKEKLIKSQIAEMESKLRRDRTELNHGMNKYEKFRNNQSPASSEFENTFPNVFTGSYRNAIDGGNYQNSGFTNGDFDDFSDDGQYNFNEAMSAFGGLDIDMNADKSEPNQSIFTQQPPSSAKLFGSGIIHSQFNMAQALGLDGSDDDENGLFDNGGEDPLAALLRTLEEDESGSVRGPSDCLSYETWSSDLNMCVGCKRFNSMWNIIDSTLRQNGAHIADQVELHQLKAKIEASGEDSNKILGDCDSKNVAFYGPNHPCRIVCNKGLVAKNGGEGTQLFRCFCHAGRGCEWLYGGRNGEHILECIDPEDPIARQELVQAAEINNNPRAIKILESINKKQIRQEKLANKVPKLEKIVSQRQMKASEKMESLKSLKNPIKVEYFYVHRINHQILSTQVENFKHLINNNHITIIHGVTHNDADWLANWMQGISEDLTTETHKWSYLATQLVGKPNSGKYERAIVFWRNDKVNIDKAIQLSEDSRFTYAPFMLSVSRKKHQYQKQINMQVPKGIYQSFSIIVVRGDDSLRKNPEKKEIELMNYPNLLENFRDQITQSDPTQKFYNATMIIGNFFDDCTFMPDLNYKKWLEEFETTWTIPKRWHMKTFPEDDPGVVIGSKKPCVLNKVLTLSRKDDSLCADLKVDGRLSTSAIRSMSTFFRPVVCNVE